MKPKVYVARPVPPEVLSCLEEHCTVIRPEPGTRPGREQFFAALRDVDGLLTSGTRIDATLLDQAPKLRIVSYMSVGYNNFDLEEMRRRGVMGTHTPGVLDDTVADLVMTLMLSAARRVPELDRYIREGRWTSRDDEQLFGIDVHHAELGIIGMGRIGQAVAKRARFGFDMRISYSNRRRNPEAEKQFDAVFKPMDQLLAESDFIVVMTPLTADTEGLIGAREFGLMKRDAIFINVSRGPVVDEQAMIDALQGGKIRAAGLDVFQQEPVDPDNPLLKLDNTVLLPHVGSATARTRADMAMLAARNLVAGLTGQVPPNLVPELG